MTGVRASAPGKLILMGEHAVVYGQPALVAAVDLRLHAAFTHLDEPSDAAAGRLVIRAPGAGSARTEEATSWPGLLAHADAARDRWERYAEAPSTERFQEVRGEDPFHLTKVALGEAGAHLLAGSAGDDVTSLPALRLEMDSEIPIGRGMGSSAALAVGVVAGALRACGAAADPELVERLALEVERRQHGFPSGVDGATVLNGGMIWVESGAAGGLQVSAVHDATGALGAFGVFDTGAPAESTGSVVAAVRERVEGEPARYERLLTEMGGATRRFRAGVSSGEADSGVLMACIREYQRALEELGVVPATVRELVRRVEKEGGAAKISGAGSLGAAGAGCLLIYHPDPAAARSWSFLAGLRRYPVSLGAPGLRLEAA